MSIYKLNREFIERIDFSIPARTAILCGNGKSFKFESALTLIADLLSEWQSPAVIMMYYLNHQKFTNPKFSPVSGLLLSDDAAENRTAIAGVLQKEAVISFYDLAAGGNATFQINRPDPAADDYDFFVSGQGRYSDIAKKAQSLNGAIVLFTFKN